MNKKTAIEVAKVLKLTAIKKDDESWEVE